MTSTEGPGFEVVRPLGQGGMATVFEVRRPGDPRRLALKVLRGVSARGVERLRREGEVVARLRHPGIVSAVDAGALPDGAPYLLFELVEGQTLGERLRAGPPPEEACVVGWGRALASALAHAHAAGVVHRDVKPDNVLVDLDGRLRLADFGVALVLDLERLTRTGQVVGTPSHMAPEQAGGPGGVGPWTDVHALGALLFEACCGASPFEGPDLATCLASVIGAPAPRLRERRPDASPGLEAVVARCLAKDPSARYPDAGALLADLERLAAGQRPDALGRAPRRWPIAAAAALVVALVVALVWAVVGAAARVGEPPAAPVVSPAPATTAPEPDVAEAAFGWSLSPGGAFDVRLEIGAGAGGGLSYVVTLTCAEATAERLRLDGVIRAVRIDPGPGAPAAGFDSEGPAAEQAAWLRHLGLAVGAPLRVVLAPTTGAVLEVTGLDALDERLRAAGGPVGGIRDVTMRALLGVLGDVLPGGAAPDVGESWTRDAPVLGPTHVGRGRRRVTLEARRGDEVRLGWRLVGAPEWPEGARAVHSVRARGHAALAGGRLLEAEAQIDGEVAGGGGPFSQRLRWQIQD
ncbi:MAG: serine/threonine protein kinase [Planctomycetes bacterium]|nr:serine/threonine protein kinase [Planctomycetota bacterium]